jgi:hypothetical protein
MMVWTVSSTETFYCHLNSYSQILFRYQNDYSHDIFEEDVKHFIPLLASIDNSEHPLPLCTSVSNDFHIPLTSPSHDIVVLHNDFNLLSGSSIYHSIRLFARIKQFHTVIHQDTKSESASYIRL